MNRTHGADIYSPQGLPQPLLDFSSTVVPLDPPAGWRRRLAAGLSSLRLYPQPYAAGLSARLERELGLRAGSLLVGSGSSECLEWIAQSLRGGRALLESPCFGEYEPWLVRHGVKVRELGADEPYAPEWPRLSKAARRAHSLWIANPSNPTGLCLTKAEFKEQLAFCREHGILLVLDEALRSQALPPMDESFLRLAVEKPGCLVVRSLGKGLGLPGLRLGYVAGHPAQTAKLGAYLNPWNLGSLAQSAGHWLFEQERRLAARRAAALKRAKQDLLDRIKRLLSGRLRPLPSDCGFFLARLLGPWDDSRQVAARLKARGLLVRSCASYGGWGQGYLRLNPRSPRDNARLVAGLRRVLK